MKAFNSKVIVTNIKQENTWGYEDKEAAKLGKVAFPFNGKIEEDPVELKKGDEVYYQYGTDVKIEGVAYTLVALNNLICLK